MRLIDADICLHEAWQNFYKQEDEHKKNIDGYDIMRDRFYEQSGFECCQQTIVNAPTVEAIPKADYENRLKADMVAMLKELEVELYEKQYNYNNRWVVNHRDISKLINEKINALKGEKNE